MRRFDRWDGAATGLSATYFGLLWWTAPAMGYTRDEGYYFKAAEEYAGWWAVLLSTRFFEAFRDAEIMKHLGYNTEHPPLAKWVFGVSHHVLHGLGIASDGQAFRAGGFAFAALALVATYLLGRRLAGPAVGLFAAAALASLPRWFYDAHLACFDVPITAMWTLSLWAFHRAWTAPPDRLWVRSVALGLVFGLALATKLNALFLPFIFLLAWLLAPPERLWPMWRPGPSGGPDLVLPRIPVPLLAAGVLGPLVFVATWPYLWHRTFERIGGYLQFHMRHEHYPISYFHELYVAPPFPVHFPVVMTAVTVPAALSFLGAVGLILAARALARPHRRFDAGLVLLATLIPIALIAMPSTPIFGGVKHWYNAMPTLFIAAGVALQSAVKGVGRPQLFPVAAAVVLAAGVFGTAASHPNGIGYYDAVVGGFRGGADLGMQRGFWGGLARPAFVALPETGRVYFNRTNYDSFKMYQKEGTFGPDVSYANEARFCDAAIGFEQPEHGENEAEIWTYVGPRPVAGTYQDGVTLTQIYRRAQSSAPPTPATGGP